MDKKCDYEIIPFIGTITFNYNQFKEILKDKSVKEIYLTQGHKVFIGKLVDVPNGFIVNGKTFYEGITRICLDQYKILEEDNCINIIENLKEYFEISAKEKENYFIFKDKEKERLSITDKRICIDGYSIVYRRRI